jgi:CDP-glycerol glycerophosphotransferase
MSGRRAALPRLLRLVPALLFEPVHVRERPLLLPHLRQTDAPGVPDVTVVVIGYNDVANLATAVGSVLDQTLHNLEVVIVDDASTDGTAGVADRLAAEHAQVRAIHLPENSGGCSRPRNVGIEHARAPYVMFLDSDDVYERHACKNLLLEAERTGADVVAGKCVRIFLDRDGEQVWAPELFRERATYAGVRGNPELFFDPLSTNKIYRRQFLDDADIRFPEGVHYEDSLFSTKVYIQANLIAVIPNVVYYWNVVRDAEVKSITQRRLEFTNFSDRIAVHRMMDDYLLAHGAGDLKVHKDVKFIRHDLRLYLRFLSARDPDYQQKFVRLAADYLASVSEQTLAMVNPVQRILVHMLRRQDIDETLKAVQYLRHGYKVSSELVERDGRVYWSAKYLDTPEGRAIMDVTQMGLHRTPFSEQSLYNEVTTLDITGRRMRLEGRLLNQFRRIQPTDDLRLTLVVRRRGTQPRREVRVTVLGHEGAYVRWRADVDLLDVTRPFDQLIPAWDLRMEVRWNGALNAPTLSIDPRVLTPHSVALRGRFGGLARGRISPYVTFNGNLALQQARDDGVARFSGRAHALAQRAKWSARRRALNVVSHRGAKRRAYQLFRRLPVKHGLVVFESHLGKQYSDNPKYVYEAAREIGFGDLGLRPVWSYADRPTGLPTDAAHVLRNSWRYYYLLARAQYWVDNQGFPRVFTKRPETTYLQTWHGTPLKTMGWDEPRLAGLSPARRRAHEQMIERWDYLVAPSEYFVETFVRAYRYDGKLLRVGYPRNDLLVNKAGDADQVADAKRRLGLPLDRTIVLYAPTFRDRGRRGGTDYELPFDLEQLAVSLRDEVFLLVRTHYLDDFVMERSTASFAKDVSAHQDMTELLLVADVLVTDYSSTMFDFANTGRPIVFFTHDYDDYTRSERGTYFDLPTVAPGPLVTTTEQLRDALADLDGVRRDYADRYTAWRRRFCEYDDGHAAVDVVNAVFGSGGADDHR